MITRDEARKDVVSDHGMSSRQFYKAAALTGLLARDSLSTNLPHDPAQQVAVIVKSAAVFADAMIAEDNEAAKP